MEDEDSDATQPYARGGRAGVDGKSISCPFEISTAAAISFGKRVGERSSCHIQAEEEGEPKVRTKHTSLLPAIPHSLSRVGIKI